MLVQKVDIICLQTAQRSLHNFPDVRGPTVRACDFAILNPEAEFRGDDRPLSPALERPADEFFVAEGSVGFGGIEKIQPEVESPVDCGDGFGIVRNTVGLAHSHATQTQGGHFQSLRSPDFASVAYRSMMPDSELPSDSGLRQRTSSK